MSERKCYLCGKDPAEGFASTWTAKDGERWYCHGDDDDVSCYEAKQAGDDWGTILGLIGEPLVRDLDKLTEWEAPAPRCAECGPGYRIGDEGCRHGTAAAEEIR